MKKWISYGAFLIVVGAAVALTVLAPDILSRIFGGVMTGIVVVGGFLGVFPVINYSAGFNHAARNILTAQKTQTSMPWLAVVKMDNFFNQRVLDRLFEQYREKVEEERKNNMIIEGIDEMINEEEISVRCWQGVVLQIPRTLTGLGLLGTFIGLITGISSVQISSVDATLASIQTLFDGIRVAFYTSISGVILSVLFNIVYKFLWNIMLRDLGMFTASFQRNIIPSVEEQERYSQKKDMEKIQDKLKHLPRNEGYSLANSNGAMFSNAGSESVLMPQIMTGLKNGEFTFYLQPRFDLNTQRITGAEALVRWNHAKLGLIAPSVFIPILEKNGYIAKLDQYIWDKVCAKIREWVDAGLHPVPIAVNISKTDVLALDISEVFTDMIQKYRLPPKYVEFDIAQNAYLESRNIALQFEKTLQQRGFRVVVDGFKGAFFELYSGEEAPCADAYKLDLRFCHEDVNITSIAEQARNMQVDLMAEGIESMKQMSLLRKNGITEGQGFYLSKPVPIEEFEKMMNWREE